MIDYAKREFELMKPINKESKQTQREALRQVEKTTGKPHKDLINPMPSGMGYLWELYGSVKLGCDRVTVESISAYTTITRRNLTQYELECLLLIEQKRIEVFYND